MKVGIVTSIKAPYRTLQIEEICKNKSLDITVYYTKRGKEDRDWEVRDTTSFKEKYLASIKFFDKLGTLNIGLKEIVKSNDIIIIGGYEKPTYIFISLLCRFYKKKYIIVFDGISTNRLDLKENQLKWILKNLVIKHSSAIWANGTVSKKYFNEKFKYPIDKIYNQYLTVDGEKIKEIGKNKHKLRKELRDKYGIKENDKVLQYSGRLVDVKNIKSIINALGKIKLENIKLFITGGGEQEEELKILADKFGIDIIITGFIDNQEELFKHYYLSDVFILPSIYEPWGLVVNEAMYAGLPVIVSEICGCSLDLVLDNGYLINPNDIDDIAQKIYKMLNESDLNEMSKKSELVINRWNFNNSRISFENIIKELI